MPTEVDTTAPNREAGCREAFSKGAKRSMRIRPLVRSEGVRRKNEFGGRTPERPPVFTENQI